VGLRCLLHWQNTYGNKSGPFGTGCCIGDTTNAAPIHPDVLALKENHDSE
jgi:hypothetical protein